MMRSSKQLSEDLKMNLTDAYKAEKSYKNIKAVPALSFHKLAKESMWNWKVKWQLKGTVESRPDLEEKKKIVCHK